ncbi:DUF2203 domain-containing protein [soil metagenome]
MPRYYDIDSANERLAELRPVLESLRDDRAAVAEAQLEVERLQGSDGNAEHEASLEEARRRLVVIVRRMQESVRRIDEWGVTLRDISSGLVDFPALVSGRPIWLCWRLGEGPIEWWHEIDAGIAGRQPLIELH